MRHEKLPQEAIIGITFVVASAAAILIADKAPEGAEHIKETLSGSLLWVTWPTVIKDLVIYSLVGLFHWLLRHRFLLITTDPDEAYRRGWVVRWWDFLFYLSFGVIITFSVEIGGILMVFSYLVIPACIAILLATEHADAVDSRLVDRLARIGSRAGRLVRLGLPDRTGDRRRPRSHAGVCLGHRRGPEGAPSRSLTAPGAAARAG